MAAYDRDTPDTYTTSTVDEQKKRAQAKADAAAQKVGYGGNVGSSVTNQVSNTQYANAGLQTVTPKPINKMTPEELAAYQASRVADQTAARETGNGTTPPYEAPSGSHWSFINGQWKLYKDFGTQDTTDTIISSVDNGDGTTTNTYKSGRKETLQTYNKGAAPADAAAAATKYAADVKAASDKYAADLVLKQAEEAKLKDRQSAYDLLYNEFSKYGLGALAEEVKGLIQSNVSPSQFAIELQNKPAYQQRFKANQDRIKAGLKALSPAEYIGLEDQYQNIMRNYGLPASYYTKDSMGTQQGFEKFIGNDVSAAELEDRIATAQKRVLNTNPEVLTALKQFYPDLNNADILAYTLDPTKALEEIKRKVTAAEIGGAALAQGLQAQGGTAESLAGYGITKQQAQQGYQSIAEFLPAASKLGAIYQNPYDQSTAEQEVFGTTGAATAGQKRKKLAQLETAAFSGQSGRGVLSEQRQNAAGTF